MQKLMVPMFSSSELDELDVPTLDSMLGRARSARSSLDGYIAVVGSALEKARRRPVPHVPKPGPVGDDDPDTTHPGSSPDDPPDSPDGSDGDAPSAGPPVSARQSRAERDRALRLAVHPDVREALVAGRITTEQADLLTANDLRPGIVKDLLTEAVRQTTDETRAAVREAVRSTEKGTPEDRLARQRRNRRGSCGVDDDGMYWFHARFDPTVGAPIKAEFDRRENREFHRDQNERDRGKRRSAGQRGADVMADLFSHGALRDRAASSRRGTAPTDGSPRGDDRPSGPARRSGESTSRVRRTPSSAEASSEGPPAQGPSSVGPSPDEPNSDQPPEPSAPCACSQHPPARPSIDLIADLDVLHRAGAEAVAYTASGVAVPAELARASLCHADIQLWFTNATRTELYLGTDVELATPQIRRALLIRDGSCRWRGCSVEASRCEAHHLTFRREGGGSDIDNFALLCPRHHAYLHSIGAHLRMGATADVWKLVDDHTRRVIDEWTMPLPRRNSARRRPRPPNDIGDEAA